MEPETSSILDRFIQTKKEQSIQQFHPLEIAKKLLEKLHEREREILHRRFGLLSNTPEQKKDTLETIGKELGITRERVRQIEKEGIVKLKDLKKKDLPEVFQILEDVLDRLFTLHGEVMEETLLLEKLTELCSVQIANVEHILLFFIEHLLDRQLEKVPASEHVRKSWKQPFVQMDFTMETLSQLERLIESEKQRLKFETLHDKFLKTGFYQEHQEKFNEQILLSYLRLSKKIQQNIFGEWGLSHWKTIAPKRMGDKIYLILMKFRKPMHFTEITEEINKAHFDHKSAYPATVHNELILDKRYVLVGRGIYALKDWGYNEGTVADVIERFLRERGGPVSQKEIYEEVLKQRIVKAATIQLALTNREKFVRTENGDYILNSSVS